MNKPKAVDQAWSNFWRKGFLSTFVDSEGDNYSGAIKAYWFRVFSHVPKEANLVDLGAGNGAILALASEYVQSQQHPIYLIGVDYADISESDFFHDHPEIEVHSSTRIENTGLTSNSIAQCTSQFAYEYADTVKAAKELYRFLQPGGRFNALMHHQQSAVTHRSISAVNQVALCERSKLTTTSRELLLRLHQLKQKGHDAVKDKDAADLRDHFNNMVARVNKYADDFPDSDHVTYFLNELGNLFGPKAKDLSVDQKVAIIDQLEIDSEEYLKRMQAMIDASSDDAKIKVIVEQLQETGLQVELTKTFEADGQKFAWIVEAVKP